MKFLFFLLFFFGIVSCSSEKTYGEGKELYRIHCSGCHGNVGQGLESLIPPLAGADILINSSANAACWIRNGMEGKIIVNGIEFDNAMPANKRLSATEIVNILNYIRNAWGNKNKFITLEEVNKALKNCP